MVHCVSCGADLGYDDDPYADPDCPHCLEASIRAETENGVDAEGGAE